MFYTFLLGICHGTDTPKYTEKAKEWHHFYDNGRHGMVRIVPKDDTQDDDGYATDDTDTDSSRFTDAEDLPEDIYPNLYKQPSYYTQFITCLHYLKDWLYGFFVSQDDPHPIVDRLNKYPEYMWS